MSESDDGFEDRLWDLVEIGPGQQPEFGIVAVSYIDLDGHQRFSWRIASATEGVDLEPVLELLNQLSHSVQAHTEVLPLDPFEG